MRSLISTGKSSLNAVDALSAAGANIKGMVAIFTYGFAVAEENFDTKKLDLHTLSDYEHLIEQASETGYIKDEQLNTLMEWRKTPSQWQQ